MREVMAGIVGIVIFVTCSALLFKLGGYDPHRAVSLQFQVTSIAAGVVFALFSGYVTASLSPSSPMRPAAIVALFIAVMAILSMLTSGSAEAWSQLAALFMMAPAVLMGARMRARRVPRQNHTNQGAL
ncbi:MAG: hypothetical protein ABIS27_00450 [Longimicrobiales bacterium]